MSNEKILLNILHQLKPTGYDGFEGLIAKLLENLTGNRFYLAKSGFQAGKDMSTGGIGGKYNSVECKRYSVNSKLGNRDILGELVQAYQSNPDLDLWVIVSSAHIHNQLMESLSRLAQSFGIEVMTIETQDGIPSSLEVLCAYGQEIIIEHIQKKSSKLNKLKIKKIKDELNNIKLQKNYNNNVLRLQESFSTTEIGYDNWRVTQNEWLLNQFSSESASRSSFGQIINVKDRNIKMVVRKKAFNQIDNWLSNWDEAKNIFVLLGEEGDGKTWALASWVSNYIKNSDSAPVVFLCSQNVPSTDVSAMLSNTISRQIKTHHPDFWEKRIQKWMKRPNKSDPTIILIIDGINENYNFDWRKIFEELQSDPWVERVALVLTCRKIYWEKNFQHLESLKFKHWILPPYNDMELSIALKQQNLIISDIPASLNDLVRKPRYFDLIIKFRRKIDESGDITIHRLIYEDFKDRINRKRNKNLNHSDFEGILIGLAEKYKSGTNVFNINEISEFTSKNKEAISEELISSGIFIQDQLRSYNFKVEPKRFAHALGFLLIDEINNVAKNGEGAVEECIGSFLEPQPEMDFKVSILSSAAFHSMINSSFPEIGRIVLLKYWINSKNLDDESIESFPSYFPCNPDTYFKLAEFIWSDIGHNIMAERLIMHTFLEWSKYKKFLEKFKLKFEEWMGYINIYGFFFIRGRGEEKKEEMKHEIQKRLEIETNLGPVSFNGYSLTIFDKEDVLRLSRVALTVISHLDRKIFLHAIVIGVLSETIMGYPSKYELFEWILHSSSEPIWPALEKEVLNLIDKNKLVTNQTAYRLLSYYGSPEALKIREKLPKDLFGINTIKKMYKEDPCKYFKWEKKNYLKCLSRRDFKPFFIFEKMKNLAIDPNLKVPKNLRQKFIPFKKSIKPNLIWSGGSCMTKEDYSVENSEAFICAFFPTIYSQIIKSIILDISNRKGGSLRQIPLRLGENLLILEKKEMTEIRKSWENLHKKKKLDDHESNTEAFLFSVLISNYSALNQLEILLRRHDEGIDLLKFELFFKKLDSKSWDWVLKKIENPINGNELRRILWFLAKFPNDIPQKIFDEIEKLFFDKENLTRRSAIKIACLSENRKIIQTFINSSWSWDKKNHYEENFYGSLILSKFGNNLPYVEIRSRVFPNLIGYAVSERGYKSEEIVKYANDLNSMWGKINEISIQPIKNLPPIDINLNCKNKEPKLKTISFSSSNFSKSIKFQSRNEVWGGLEDFDDKDLENLFKPITSKDLNKYRESYKNEKRKLLDAGNTWFLEEFYRDSLKEVIKLKPDIVKNWLNNLYPESYSTDSLIISNGSFYHWLCIVLLENNSNDGILLYNRIKKVKSLIRYVDSNTKIETLTYELFKLKGNNEVKKIWDEMVENCINDISILELSVVNQSVKNSEWLKQKIEKYLKSNSLFRIARGIIMLGFMDEKYSIDKLLKLEKETPNSWIKQVIKISIKYWNYNYWSKTWFNNFLESENKTVSWASFKLFLKCVDRRFWIWKDKMMNNYKKKPFYKSRKYFFELNRDSVKKNIERNEKKLKEVFLGKKIVNHQIWPWM